MQRARNAVGRRAPPLGGLRGRARAFAARAGARAAGARATSDSSSSTARRAPSARSASIRSSMQATRSSSRRAASAARERLGELGQRRPAPERERFTQTLRGGPGVSRATAARPVREAARMPRVGLPAVHLHRVTGRARVEHALSGATCAAARRRRAPSSTAESGTSSPHSSSTIGRDGPVHVEHEARQEPRCFRPATVTAASRRTLRTDRGGGTPSSARRYQ